MVKKSVSNVYEKPKRFILSGFKRVLAVSEQSISMFTSTSSSIDLNIHKKPSDESAKEVIPGNASHTLKSACFENFLSYK